MAVIPLDTSLPRNGDATAQAEVRQNLDAMAHLVGVAPIATLTGLNATPTPLDPASYAVFNLTTHATGGANDFDLAAPAHVGQTIAITLVTKDTQNATVTEAAGCTIVTATGGAVASITLDADAEFAVLRAIAAGVWVILATSGTVA